MSVKSVIGKTIVLLLMIVILIFLGLFWFDYLGVIQAKKMFAPVYKMLGLQVQSSITAADTVYTEADLETDRLAKRLEALDLRSQELDKREQDISQQEAKNVQINQELEDRRVSQEEREAAFNAAIQKYNDRDVNIIQNAKNLTGMEPQKAVEILLAMDDQDVIDVLRKVEEIAQQNNKNSIVAFWLSLMPAERSSTIQRKMLNKPAATVESATPAAQAN